MSRSNIYIPTGVFDELRRKAGVNHIAVYITLVRCYKKPIFYNYTPESLSKKTGIPISRVRKGIAALRRMGLVYKEGKHLRILNKLAFNSIYKGRTIPIKINRNDSFSDVKIKLQFVVFKNLIDKQKYVIDVFDSLKTLEDKTCSWERRKSLYSFVKKGIKKLKGYDFAKTEGRSRDIVLGYRKIAIELNIAMGSINKFLVDLKRLGLIKGFEKKVERVKYLKGEEAIITQMNEYYGSDRKDIFYSFVRKGITYRHYGTIIY